MQLDSDPFAYLPMAHFTQMMPLTPMDPGAHVVHALDPGTDAISPSGHLLQFEAFVPPATGRKVPISHDAQMRDVGPPLMYCPGGHGMHLRVLKRSKKVQLGHGTQALAPPYETISFVQSIQGPAPVE